MAFKINISPTKPKDHGESPGWTCNSDFINGHTWLHRYGMRIVRQLSLWTHWPLVHHSSLITSSDDTGFSSQSHLGVDQWLPTLTLPLQPASIYTKQKWKHNSPHTVMIFIKIDLDTDVNKITRLLCHDKQKFQLPGNCLLSNHFISNLSQIVQVGSVCFANTCTALFLSLWMKALVRY